MKNNRLDYFIALFVGFLVGVFAIPTLLNLHLRNRALLLALPIVLPLVFAAGIWLAYALARKLAFMAQFGRFVAIGFLNTAIDFGILNLLSLASGITAGLVVGGINIPGFSVAVINSFFWNKFWVFKEGNKPEGLLHNFGQFLAVTIVGVIINSAIIILLTAYLPYVSHQDKRLLLNLAKAGATAVSLIWNFLGYKFIVFKTSPEQTTI